MLQRKPSNVAGQELPAEWIESVTELLNETYREQCNARGRRFEIHGQLFSSEILVIVGLNPVNDQSESSVSCFLSCDAHDMATADAVKTTQNNFVAIAGMFFDEVFADEDWNAWEPNWQEVEWKEKKYWYKMTRENVMLTLQADRLLKEAGFAEDEAADYGDEDPDKTIH